MSQLIHLENSNQLLSLLQKHEISLLYFTTTECGVCKAIYPRIESLSDNHQIPLIKVDIEAFPDIAGQHLVFTIPTILVMVKEKEATRESRFIDFNKLNRFLDILKG